MKIDYLTVYHNVITSAGIHILKIVGIVIAFFIVKKIGTKLIARSFSQVTQKENIMLARSRTLEALTINTFSYALFFIFIVMLFGVFDINVSALLAGAGVVGLAIGFGAQGLVSDFVTGFFLLLEKQLDVDDYVTTGSFSGIVEGVGLRTTKIRGFDGTLHYVPNRLITSLSNHSRGNMRALVDISISTSSDIDLAITVLQAACDKIAADDQSIKEGPKVIGVQSLGASEVVLRVIAKTENMGQWAVERKIRKALKEVLPDIASKTAASH